MKCPKCLEEIRDDAVSCVHCGWAFDGRPGDSLALPKAQAKPLSKAWREKFAIIEKAGGPNLPGMKRLTGGERWKVLSNGWAFFFGPFYYLRLGLWKQVITYFGIAMLLALTVEFIAGGRLAGDDLENIERAIGFGVEALFSHRANVSYYKKVVLGRTGWF